MDTNSITARLHEQADRELDAMVRKHTSALEDLARQAPNWNCAIDVTAYITNNGDEKARIQLTRLIYLAGTAVVEHLKESNRAKAVTEFLAKIERLESELTELRDITQQ